ncbi:MAG TPA: hypothetical protein PKL97_03450 [Candidatus Omnitrophota bacterium]|nr:hypothetical protein [Candidatus Omnitrophota bacterium]
MKKLNLKKSWLAAGIAGIVFLFGANAAFAGISVKPTVIEKVMDSGKSESDYYTLTNDGDVKLTVRIEAEDWMARLFGRPDDMKVEDWLKIEPKEITLDPKQTVKIKYTVTTPKIFLNEKVAQVFFRYQEAEYLEARVGVIFYLTPKGRETLSAEMTSFSAKQAKKEDGTPVFRLSVVIKNDSNFHIRTPGFAEIYDKAQGKVVKTLDVNRVPGIYGGRSFEFDYEFPNEVIPEGDYQVTLKLNYGSVYGKNIFMEKTADLEFEKEPAKP